MEYLVSRSGPHGTFGSLGYSQTDLLPLVQLASVTGIFGVSFTCHSEERSDEESLRVRTRESFRAPAAERSEGSEATGNPCRHVPGGQCLSLG